MSKKQKWLILDLGDGWQVIVPEIDSKPHGTRTTSKNNKIKLAGLDCPCGAKIEVGRKMIVHNSFRDQKKVEESISRLSTPKNKVY